MTHWAWTVGVAAVDELEGTAIHLIDGHAGHLPNVNCIEWDVLAILEALATLAEEFAERLQINPYRAASQLACDCPSLFSWVPSEHCCGVVPVAGRGSRAGENGRRWAV